MYNGWLYSGQQVAYIEMDFDSVVRLYCVELVKMFVVQMGALNMIDVRSEPVILCIVKMKKDDAKSRPRMAWIILENET